MNETTKGLRLDNDWFGRFNVRGNDETESKEESVNDQMEIKDWLHDTCGESLCNQYCKAFISNGYLSVGDVKGIQSKADLEKIGIVLRGHLIKIWADIKKLKKEVGNNDIG